jgi:serine/threonine protein kinase
MEEKNIICPHCNTENAVDAKFCKECGLPLKGGISEGEKTLTIREPGQKSIKEEMLPAERLNLGKRYQIIRKIGEGGMGAVYEAQDTILNVRVALKVLLPQLTSDEEVLERFKRELLVTRNLSHKNIVRVFDIGEGTLGEAPVLYISMELIRGTTLKRKIEYEGAIELNQAINIVNQLCSTLNEAHKSGIVHRDVKPQNIFLDERNQVKLVDFGIAWARGMKHLTATGYTYGTPDYMAPEQADPKQVVDFRSDIYSLGVVIYEMLTGELPFKGETPIEVIMQHAKDEPPPPSSIKPQLPPWVDEIVLKAMQKEKKNRYQSAMTIAKDFLVQKFVDESSEKRYRNEAEMREDLKRAVSAGEKPETDEDRERIEKLEKMVARELWEEKRFKELIQKEEKKVFSLRMLVLTIAIVIALTGLGIYYFFGIRGERPLPEPDKMEAATYFKGHGVMPLYYDEAIPAKEKVEKLKQKTNLAIREGRIVEPDDDCALRYLNDILFYEISNRYAEENKTKLAARFLVAGDEALAKGDKEVARKNYTSYLKIFPGNSEVKNRLASLTPSETVVETPEVKPEEAPGITPSKKSMEELLADLEAAFKNKDYPTSRRLIEEIIANDRENPLALDYLKKINQAEERLLKLRKEARNLLEIGIYYQAEKKAAEILAEYPGDREGELILSRARRSASSLPKDMVLIPASEFIMGSQEPIAGEKPISRVYLNAFLIDRYEVVNGEYLRFISATGHRIPFVYANWAQPYNWRGKRFPEGRENHPVVLVSYNDALAYTRWAGKRLPTEAEWEKAARYIDGRNYPWGKTFKPEYANSIEARVGAPIRVGSFPSGVSFYGVFDMAGNVWEWTSERFSDDSSILLIKGGSFLETKSRIFTHTREPAKADTMRIDIGFRCVKDVR